MKESGFQSLTEAYASIYTEEENLYEDVYDAILSHLLEEGYADTKESATAIMTHMSDDWKNTIIEAKYGTKAGRHKLAMKIKKGKEIGKKGPGTGFKAVEKKAKEYGARDPKAVAAAAMWKHYGK